MHHSAVQAGPGDCPLCHMALVPVADAPAAGPAAGSGVPGLASVTLPAERIQLIGVRTAPAVRQRLTQRLRATGFVGVDESRITLVTTRFSGWLDQLRKQPGERVDKGEILATVSGPEILTAQQVYLASRGWVATAKGPAVRPEDENNALQRIGVAQRDIDAITRLGRPMHAVPIRAPASGYIARRSVLPGLYVQPGAELFQIVDLSTVWVEADLSAQDARSVRVGQPAQLVAGAPGESVGGRVDFIHPALDPETRQLRVRVTLANQDLRLRPGTAGTLLIDVSGDEALTVPADAVIDTGDAQYLFVARGNGRFEPRSVRVGARAGGSVQVLEGLAEGEVVVTTANFLIDSESRMRAAVEEYGSTR